MQTFLYTDNGVRIKEKRYMPPNKKDHALIEQLLQSRAGGKPMENADLVEDIIETALRLADDGGGDTG